MLCVSVGLVTIGLQSILRRRDSGVIQMARSYEIQRTPSDTKAQYWSQVASTEYVAADAKLLDPILFSGKTTVWDVGPLSLANLSTDPVIYSRQKHHIRNDWEKEETILIGFSALSDLTFEQEGISLKCRKNQYFIQRVNQPYEFGHTDPNEIWVLRVPAKLLRWHVRSIEKYTPYIFDASRGVGALLFDTVRALPSRLAESPSRLGHDLGQYLLELFVLSLEGNEAVLGSLNAKAVKQAHLMRVERFIRGNLKRPDLTPQLIADNCNISASYLHQLFRSSGSSVGRWIRELRLNACDQNLRNPNCRNSIAEIAYRWGFSDHALFCRHFKSQFGVAPRDRRAEARVTSASSIGSP